MEHLLDLFDWRPPARQNAETYAHGDPALWTVVEPALHAILARHGAGPGDPIQFPTGLAYVMVLTVPGRDQDYMLVHHRLPGSDAPVIAFCGPKV